MDLYSPAQAAKLVGVSASTLRNYCKVYNAHLSTSATPEPGQPRQFSADDLQLIHFVATMTKRQLTHDDILARIAAGELSTYEGFAMPGSADVSASPGHVAPTVEASGAMMLLDVQRQLGEAVGRADQLERENARLTAQLDRLIAHQIRPWWKRLLGID